MTATSDCPACGANGRHWATVHDRHYRNPGTWDVHDCESCGARYLHPMPTAEQLGGYYPADYYSHQPMPASGRALKSRLKSVLLPLGTKEPVFAEPGRMLDLGCGSGWMLEYYRDRGWEAEGVEYSESACAAGRERGLTMHHGSLEDADLPTAVFDYVRTNHSFEHLTNPNATLQEISRILKPGGTLFVGVPNTNGLTARLFGREWFYVGAPVHTINYNGTNLRALLERHDFEVRRELANSNHGGTIGSAQSWLGGRLGRSVNLSQGPVTWAPLILVGFWIARLLDVLHLGDCVELTAVKRVAAA
jgi:SAM-dependent methyltransferase